LNVGLGVLRFEVRIHQTELGNFAIAISSASLWR
jgi:hypothetical protein